MKPGLWILRLIIVSVTFLTFCRLTTCGFTIWDDANTISENPRLNPPTWQTLKYYWTTAGEQETMGLYVPVTYTVWSGLAVLSDLRGNADPPNPIIFHTFNVLLHSLAAVLVFEMLWRLFAAEIPATLGALLFALHPVQVETVGWASGTKDLLYGLLAIASMLMYLRSVQAGPVTNRFASRCRYAAALLLFALAMLSKPTAVVIPLMAAVISVLLLKRPAWKTLVSLAPWFLLMIPCLIITRAVQQPTGISAFSFGTSMLVAADALAFYAWKLVWPLHLCVDYGRTPLVVVGNHQVYFTWILPAIIGALLVWRFKRATPAAAAALLFVLPLAPVLGIAPFDFQMISTVADHYLYLPMLGLAVFLTWFLTRHSTQTVLIPAVIFIITLYAVRSVLQEPVWKNSQTLDRHVLAINPRSLPACNGLGYLASRDAFALMKDRRIAQARMLFDESNRYYEQALLAAPDAVATLFNIAVNYRETGQRELSITMIHRIVATEARLPKQQRDSMLTIAGMFKEFDDVDGEIAWLEDAQQRDPGNVQISDLLARARPKHQPDRE